MPGWFILSLDCEGKWGVADLLTAAHHETLSDRRLRDAYQAIARLLADLSVPATFAVTELFLRSRDELMALPQDEIRVRLPYAAPAFDDLAAGSGEGWSAPWLSDLIGQRHERACHGVTHTPWTAMNREQARYELSLAPDSAGRTFIHPRNAVAHLDLLEEAGFAGYRLPPPRRSRAASMASEFNPFVRAEPSPPPATLQPIPGGYFINWLSGLRRIVPKAVTRHRARRVLRDAARHGRVAHFWTHPENVAAAPATLDNLAAILEEAVSLRRQGLIEMVTQIDYCRALNGGTGNGPPSSAGSGSSPVGSNGRADVVSLSSLARFNGSA
jgi:peptidoglycan/xylan/chitin deacetylase (PgdA/CDA1 family)